MGIPKGFQGVFWSRDASSLDIIEDRDYIIHQVLMYGSLDQIKWLESIYSDKEIREIFCKQPRKIYTPQAFNVASDRKRTICRSGVSREDLP